MHQPRASRLESTWHEGDKVLPGEARDVDSAAAVSIGFHPNRRNDSAPSSLLASARSSATRSRGTTDVVDLDELMDELHLLEGTHVGVSSTALALYVVGTLRIGAAQTRVIPEGTFVLTDELLTSLPAEPTDDLKGFHVGDSATVMIIPKWFVSAQRTAHGIEIELQHESISITTFNPGPPYAPQIVALGDDAASRSEELHLSTIEDRIDAELAFGRHDQLVSELEKLVAAYPHRERLRGQLMLALYRAGRKKEALQTYLIGRRLLVEEIGIEPSPELNQLKQQILADDPSLRYSDPEP